MSHNPYTRVLESFTNTPSEAHFYLTSTRCELAGVECLSLMRSSLDEAFMADDLALTRLTHYLTELAVRIDQVGEIILDMKNGCDPATFYHVIRPWFKGGDADGPGSAGWAFLGLGDDLDPGTNERRAEFIEDSSNGGEGGRGRKFSGPSAGQSTLIHALDVFLNVTHSPVEDEDEKSAEPIPESSSSSSTIETPSKPTRPRTAETTFMTRMLSYMPAPHRAFLTHLSNHPHPTRSLVLQHKHDRPALVAAYDKAIEALKRLREKHMRIATLYIIQQARREVTPELVAMGAARPASWGDESSSTGGGKGKKVHLKATDLSEVIVEVEEKQREEADDEVRGTGGTALIKFLKMCRDNTGNTVIGGRA